MRWTTEDGQERVVPAASLVRHKQKGNALAGEWIFGGSLHTRQRPENSSFEDYPANSGHVVSVENRPEAVVDISVVNPEADPGERVYEAWTERLPPVDTPVQLVFTLAR